MTTLFDVAEMLKQARGEARLSQEALASRAGVSRSTVARMETMGLGPCPVIGSGRIRLETGEGRS
ncbi:helix-turn-helix transcriptional regulator [Pseudomonas sp. NFACC08-1]|uniref:helix-turn-helix transcriptional regulator n=1 Tax=Pseudomonas sp. NFACC08-1 TaxID=1566238 RepID=UPI003531C989